MEIRAAGRRFGPSEQSLSAPVAPPAALQRDGSPLPPPDSEDEQDAAAEGTDPCTQSLHQAVWLGDVHQILELLEKQADVNAEDVHGVTPLMLAVELMPRAEEYQAVVDCLLHQGARPRVRSSSGWSPLDEAVSRRDGSLVRKLFDAAQQDLRQRWDVRLASIARSLELLPDFECQIRWEFDSPVIPLLNRIAPSDVIIVRKRGSCLRLDSTLASWKRFRFSKRRNLTTLFIGEKLDGDEKAARGLFMVNHDKLAVVDMTEGLDGEEAAAVVEDLVKADAMQWDMSIATLEVAESTTWLGSPAGVCDLNGWSCMRYEVRGELGFLAEVASFRTEGVTFQDYFGHPLPVSACLPELRQKFAEPSERLGGGGVGAAEVSPGFVVVGFSFLGGELALPDLADLLDFLPSWFSVICAFKAAKS
ncbi:unnamed protein product [Effrenium voratum]|nr:unnamed protein product [Effrenium voratum]